MKKRIRWPDWLSGTLPAGYFKLESLYDSGQGYRDSFPFSEANQFAFLKVLKPIKVYKKVYSYSDYGNGSGIARVVISLILQPGTTVCRTKGENKMRANRALVGNHKLSNNVFSAHNHNFHYLAGSLVYPDGFERKPIDHCATGIHFFISRSSAQRINI